MTEDMWCNVRERMIRMKFVVRFDDQIDLLANISSSIRGAGSGMEKNKILMPVYDRVCADEDVNFK